MSVSQQPLSSPPPSAAVQRRLQGPPAKRKFLAVDPLAQEKRDNVLLQLPRKKGGSLLRFQFFWKRHAVACVLEIVILAQFTDILQIRWNGPSSLAARQPPFVMCNPAPSADSTSKDWRPILARVRSGDQEAQVELVETLWPQVAGRIHGLCPRRETVEDLSQEVYARIFSKLEQYRGGVFEAWVDQLTRRICYDALRKQRVRPEWTFTDLGEDGPAEAAQEPPDPADLDAAEVLEKLFALLPPEIAWLLDEVELKERPIGEVAREMGWTNTAGRLRLFRARRKLETVFERWNHE